MLEGKLIKDLNQFKKKFYKSGKIYKSFCEQNVQKFDSDIKTLISGRGVSISINSKSSYGHIIYLN